MLRDGRGRVEPALVSVSLPPLQQRHGPTGPGSAHRVAPGHDRPPTPPPRPESSLLQSTAVSPAAVSSPSSGPGRGLTAALQLPASLSSLEPAPATPISLTSPRQPASRTQNVYVDTPLKGASVVGKPLRHCSSAPGGIKNNVGRSRPLTLQPTHHSVSVITAQPHHPKKTAALQLPEPAAKVPVLQPSSNDSIICVTCGRCRCNACATPKPLPQTWLCDNSCLCSAASVVDTVTCMCCVKGAWYHCGERLDKDSDIDDTNWMDSPCSCHHNKWWLRWGCLALFSLPLPCLLCYPLLRGLTKGAEHCYQAAMRQGCQCPPPTAAAVTSDSLSSTSLTSSSSLSTTQPSSLSSPSDSQKRLLG